jgi:hypothetical protein
MDASQQILDFGNENDLFLWGYFNIKELADVQRSGAAPIR